MLRETALRITSKVTILLIRAIFKLPNFVVASIIGLVFKIGKSSGLPKEALSDIEDARRAMRHGPPLSESLRGMILKSDPEFMADFLFYALRGDRPIEEVDPW